MRNSVSAAPYHPSNSTPIERHIVGAAPLTCAFVASFSRLRYIKKATSPISFGIESGSTNSGSVVDDTTASHK